MKKKDMAVAAIQSSRGLLVCPICRGTMAVADSSALRCPSGHAFDISSSGYVNLLTRPVHSDYGAAMLEARRRVCAAGFFDALLDAMVSLINEYSKDSVVLLDAGCGEGSQLAHIAGAANRLAAGVGVDISKDGIRIAAREHPGFLWLVGDLTRLPLADGSVDVVINILSPSNYTEFNRVLKPGGLFIKAAPGVGYLRELRQALYAGRAQEEYSNDRVAGLFGQSFAAETRREIRQRFPVGPGLWPDIVAMTPLAWGREEAAVRSVLENPPDFITLDFLLLTGSRGA